MDADFERRFGGTRRLYGAKALARFRQAKVCVVGIGGVGSWAAEALARSAIGQITLIDLDNIAESNANRQIHATEENFGKAKVAAMAARIRSINPECVVTEVEDFLSPENTDSVLDTRFDVVIDAIDQVKAKVAMIVWCSQSSVPIVVAGAAGGKIDPTQIKLDDLSRTVQDPLLARVRSLLRKDHGFARDSKRKFGIQAVYSSEALSQPISEEGCPISTNPNGLNCAGYGSAVSITASFGLFAASAALRIIAESN